MRVAFAGTPPFAARALEAIASAGHSIPLVLTQPDRPSGRGLKLTPSAVSTAAQALSLRVEKPASLRTEESLELIRAANADVMVVAAYGLILPLAVLRIPRHGCINIHASLLPRWRGAAPIQRAILAGDRETGISIMQMDEGLDTGPVLLEKPHPIPPRATTATLTEALAGLGAAGVVEALERLGEWIPRAQDNASATYAAKIAKAEARVDWGASNVQIDRQVRAFDPAPGAEASLSGEGVKIWLAEPVEGSGAAGEVIAADPRGIVVGGGRGGGGRRVLERPGGRRLPAAQFLQKNGAAGQRNVFPSD